MRKSIYVEGLNHGSNPIPTACVIGNFLETGAVFGMSSETHTIPEDELSQVEILFDNVHKILECAGFSFNDIIKLTFYLKPNASRDLLNKFWLKYFPDENSRPSRHVIISEFFPKSQFIQATFSAVSTN